MSDLTGYDQAVLLMSAMGLTVGVMALVFTYYFLLPRDNERDESGEPGA